MFLFSQNLRAEELTWDRSPIQIDLLVGVEKRIDFPADVRVGLPPNLSDKEILRKESVNGSVYLTAIKPFSTERVYISFVKNGQLILLDLSARAKQKTEVVDSVPPLKVVLKDSDYEALVAVESPKTAEGDSSSDDEATKVAKDGTAITPITLSRYASQQLYAPARLIPSNPNIQRVPMRTPKILSQLYAGGDVRPEPIATWSGGGLYVTAIKLSNATKEVVELDPRKFRGRILHVAFQDKSLRLGPAGSNTDITTVYLITDRPFADSVTLKG